MTLLQQLIFYLSSFLFAVIPTSSYVEGVAGQPQSFLPHQAVTQQDKTVAHLIYRGLFKYDIYGNLIPDLADTWEVSDEGLVYTVKLKAHQKWTNGQTITSDDLIYTAFKIPDLQGVATDKVDNLTVRYTLPNKFSPFISMLTVGVMQANSEETFNPLTPASSGDFRILRIKRSGPAIKEVILGTDNPSFKTRKLVFRYYSNEEEVVTAAKLGEIDGFLAHEDHEIANFVNKRFPLQGVYYAVYFNLANEKFTPLDTRQAFARVIDIDNLIFNRGIFVQGPVSRSLFTDNELAFNKFDSTFRSNLDMTVTLTVPDTEVHRQIAKSLNDAWRDKLGVNVDVIRVAPDEMLEKVIKPKDFEILLYGQEIGRDPDRYVNWHSTQKDFPGLNIPGFEQVRADRALEEGRVQLDNDARVIHYNEFQKVINDQVPAIFLYHPYRNFYVSRFFDGIGEKYTFNPTDRFLDFYNWNRIKTN